MQPFSYTFIVFALFWILNCSDNITNNDQLNNTDTIKTIHSKIINGKVKDISGYISIEDAEITFIAQNDLSKNKPGFVDSVTTFSSKDGYFELKVSDSVSYDVKVFALKFESLNFKIDSENDISLDIKLNPIDYYPAIKGKSWQYNFIAEDRNYNNWHYEVTITRTIVAYTDTSITNKIYINGWGYDLYDRPTKDIFEINKTYEIFETKDKKGNYNCFFASLPFRGIGNEFREISKYLHPDPRSIETNPSSMIPCVAIDNFNSFQKVLKSEHYYFNYDVVPVQERTTILMANYFGIVSIEHYYRDDFTDIYYKLEIK